MDLAKSKLIQLLATFSAWEWRHWRAFLASPAHNAHEGLQVLAGCLAAAGPAAGQLEARDLARAVWGEAPYRPRALRDLLAQLTRLTETFLALRQWADDGEAQDRYLLQALEDRGLASQHRQVAARSERGLSPPWDEGRLWHRYAVAASRLRMQARRPRRQPDAQLPETVAALDHWYLLQRLRYGCALLNRQAVLAQEGDFALMPFLLDYVEQQAARFADTPLIGAYARLYRLQEQGKQGAFDEALTFIQHHTPALPPGSLRELFAYLVNHCIRQVNAGQAAYEARLFDLYRLQLDQGLLHEAGVLSPWDFKNIVSLGLKMDRFAWVEAFITDQGPTLPESERAEAIGYNTAILRHAQGRVEEALRLLRGTAFDDPFYELGTRTTLLKIFYERADDEGLYYHLDAFDHYLRRPRSMSAAQKALYRELVKLTRRMASLRGRLRHGLATPGQWTRLSARLSQVPVAQRAWLQAQLDALAPEAGPFSPS